MAKKSAKKVKDLEPKKARSKKVKGGRRGLGDYAGQVGRRSIKAGGQIVDAAGTAVDATGRAFNRTLNPR